MPPTVGCEPMAEMPSRAGSLCAGLAIVVLFARWAVADPPGEWVPVVWGTDHVGQAVPEFMSGDECLFCHREVGEAWAANAHGQTIRLADPESAALTLMAQTEGLKPFANEVEYVLGSENRLRFLKRGEKYGHLDLLSVQWIPPQDEGAGHFTNGDPHHWDAVKFGANCAGCHATGVNAETKAFAASSLDCFTCHGEVPADHTEKPSLAHFSHELDQPARVVTSICAQCHVRTGTSASTGLPYPNNFIAGDDLFRDFRVDLSDEAIGALNPIDAHVLHNVRDVAVFGKEEVTCISCHTVHRPPGGMHHRVAESALCLTCHEPDSKRNRIPYEVHSARCEY